MSIKVSVKKGEVTSEVDNVRGPGCKAVLERLTEAAQLTVTKADPKDEFYAETSADATQSEGT